MTHSHNPNNTPRLTITAEELNSLPLKAFDGKVHVITEAKKFEKLARELEKHEAIGFDTETRPSFKKGQFFEVALLQLAVPNKVFLVRTQHTSLTEELTGIFENPNIIKTGVAIRDDIKALQKIKKFEPNGFLDLAVVARQLGLQVESVKKLAGLVLGIRISKSAQTSNWEALTLSEKQLEYAATDAWVCLELYHKLKKLAQQSS